MLNFSVCFNPFGLRLIVTEMLAIHNHGSCFAFILYGMVRYNMTSSEINAYDGPLGDLVHRLTQSFITEHGEPPTWIVAAPGRVNLIGEHVDYNDGFVMPMAIERYVAMAASERKTDDRRVASIRSVNLDVSAEIDLTKVPTPPESASWTSYVEGVFAGFMEKLGPKSTEKIPALNILLESNVPVGGGLSSSAALEVATATLLEAVTGVELGKAEKALICQKAEHDFAKMPCGIMDQFSSVFGQTNAFMLLDCRSQEIRQIPFSSDGISVLITNSNVKHELVGGEYAERRNGCDSALQKIGAASWRDVTTEQVDAAETKLTTTELPLARHVVSEIKRTEKAAEAIEASRWEELGDLMYQGHASLRDDFKVSCQELDLLVDIAKDIGREGGVYGSRMTGGGFGGCTVTLVDSDKVVDVSEQILKAYEEQSGVEAQLFASRPAIGAHVIPRSTP